MKRRVNMVVKKREGFRPFAPMCCYDDMKNFFTPTIEIPYMNQIVSVKPKHRKKLPAYHPHRWFIKSTNTKRRF